MSTLPNVVQINVEIYVDSTLFNVVNSNVDVHNDALTLIWRLRRRGVISTYEQRWNKDVQRWNVCWERSTLRLFNIPHTLVLPFLIMPLFPSLTQDLILMLRTFQIKMQLKSVRNSLTDLINSCHKELIDSVRKWLTLYLVLFIAYCSIYPIIVTRNGKIACKHIPSTKKSLWYLEIYRTVQNTADQY